MACCLSNEEYLSDPLINEFSFVYAFGNISVLSLAVYHCSESCVEKYLKQIKQNDLWVKDEVKTLSRQRSQKWWLWSVCDWEILNDARSRKLTVADKVVLEVSASFKNPSLFLWFIISVVTWHIVNTRRLSGWSGEFPSAAEPALRAGLEKRRWTEWELKEIKLFFWHYLWVGTSRSWESVLFLVIASFSLLGITESDLASIPY